MAAFRVFLIALALTAPVWALSAIPAHACSCGSTWVPLLDAEIVAVGIVGDVRPAAPLPVRDDEPELPPGDTLASQYFSRVEVISEILVDEYLRGAAGDALLVHSSTTVQVDPDGELTVADGIQPDCGYGLRLDARYLVFFSDANEEYWTSGCSGNVREIRHDDALTDIRQLLQEPVTQPTVVDLPETGMGSGDTDSSVGWQVTAAAGVLLTASASVIFVTLRRRPS